MSCHSRIRCLKNLLLPANLQKLHLAPKRIRNIDAISRNGERYAIKTIRLLNKTTGVFYRLGNPDNVVSEKKFEHLIIVILNWSKVNILDRCFCQIWGELHPYSAWSSKIYSVIINCMTFSSVVWHYDGLGIIVIAALTFFLLSLFNLSKIFTAHIHIKHLLVSFFSIFLFYLSIILTSPQFVHNTFFSGNVPLENLFIRGVMWIFTIYLVLEYLNKINIYKNVSKKALMSVILVNIFFILIKCLSLFGRGTHFNAFFSKLEFSWVQFSLILIFLLLVNIFLAIKIIRNDQKFINKYVLFILIAVLLFVLSLKSGWMFLDYI